MAKRRSQAYYRRNEKSTMKSLGFEPTPGSGSGWIDKEDGQTETTIAQLKSTDASSVRINLLDIQKLESNAIVSNKRPVFIIQFLKDNSIYILVRPDDDIMDIIHSGNIAQPVRLLDSDIDDIQPNNQIITTSQAGRDKFHEERNKTYAEQNEAYRKVRRAYDKEKSNYRPKP